MTDAVRQMAKGLAGADRSRRRTLVEERRNAGLTQAGIADILGVPEEWVNWIESYDSDPRLSEMRRYECALFAGKHGLV